MIFWDSSALVPLLVEQQHSASLSRFASSTPGMFAWWGTKIECVSALMRLTRDGYLSEMEAGEALRSLAIIAKGFSEVQPTEEVRATSIRLLRVHPLRSADSLQLAAALVVCRQQPAEVSFVCLDARLRTAAGREGFRVLPASLEG